MALAIEAKDILIRWVGDNKPYTDADETFLALLDDALNMVYDNVPDIEALVSNGITSLSTVKQVLTAVLTRYYAVGQEYRNSFSESVGTFAHSASMGDNSNGLGVMRILPEELALLQGKRTNSKMGNAKWGNEYRYYDAEYREYITVNTYPPKGVLK